MQEVTAGEAFDRKEKHVVLQLSQTASCSLRLSHFISIHHGILTVNS